MKVITAEALALEAPRKWAYQYRDTRHGEDKKDIGRKLDALQPDQLTPATINAVIGNDSWTRVPKCDECENETPGVVIELGQEPDYESHTARLCVPCIQAAHKLIVTGQAK